MCAERSSVDVDIDTLVDDYRARCLWFLREDYYPATREARLRILAAIQRQGDRPAHVRAATLRCLLQSSSDASAGS